MITLTFEQWLNQKFGRDNPDGFEDWIETFYPDDWIKMADEYALYILRAERTAI